MFRILYILSCTVFLLTGPFSLGILVSASKIQVEREKLKRLYLIFRNVALVALLLTLLILVRYAFLGPDPE